MPTDYHVNVSDLAICQRCPALCAYKFHRNNKSAWRVGIKGNERYGSIFHKEISEKFFRAASNPRNSLYNKINFAASKGADSLEKLVREKFFIPLIEAQEEYLTSSQILAIAGAVRTWIQGMLIFFKNSRPVFLKPEEKLQAVYKTQDSNLIIPGRYDALIFKPDEAEARLFEFKGYSKSNITVPLSQSLIYAWLLKKCTGIIPSIEIIYLDEKLPKNPEIFDSKTVKNLIISGLPGLFNSALDIILLRRLPNFMQDKNLCGCCKFKDTCEDDMKKIFSRKFNFRSRRRGASLLSLMIFFMAAIIITAQVFFFSDISAKSVREDRDLQSVRMQLYALTDEIKQDFIGKGEAKLDFKGNRKNPNKAAQLRFDRGVFTDRTVSVDYKTFYGNSGTDVNVDSGGARASVQDTDAAHWGQRDLLAVHENTISIDVFYLDYDFEATTMDESGVKEFWNSKDSKNMHRRIFPPMKDEEVKDKDGNLHYFKHFLIRVHRKMPAGNHLMLQTLIAVNNDESADIKTKTCEEIWY